MALLATSALVAAVLATPAAADPRSARTSSATGAILGSGRPTTIPGSFVVVLRDSAVGGPAGTRQSAVSTLAADVTSRFGVRPDR
ncbi:hypothetical protein AB0H63_32375, partial [Micromonospora echinospora]